MKKLTILIFFGILSTGLFAQRFTVKPYMFTITDTMYVTKNDRAYWVVISVPDWATDSTFVTGLTGTCDGDTTNGWTIAPGENLNIGWEQYPMDSLTIIPEDKARVGLFKK